jgi:hypothetical protein
MRTAVDGKIGMSKNSMARLFENLPVVLALNKSTKEMSMRIAFGYYVVVIFLSKCSRLTHTKIYMNILKGATV